MILGLPNECLTQRLDYWVSLLCFVSLLVLASDHYGRILFLQTKDTNGSMAKPHLVPATSIRVLHISRDGFHSRVKVTFQIVFVSCLPLDKFTMSWIVCNIWKKRGEWVISKDRGRNSRSFWVSCEVVDGILSKTLGSLGAIPAAAHPLIGEQIPCSGGSQPNKYQRSYGRRQAAPSGGPICTTTGNSIWAFRDDRWSAESSHWHLSGHGSGGCQQFRNWSNKEAEPIWV